MKSSTLASLLAGHAKAAAVVAAAATATAAGGVAVATVATSGNSHAAAGLAKAAAARATSAPSSASTEAATPADATTPLPCPTDVANHGAYVSSVAHATPAPSSSPNAHGKAVSEAARSACGKPSPDASESPDAGKPTSLPSQANGHATSHPTGKPGHPSHPTHP
jgi:hypothetical protein